MHALITRIRRWLEYVVERPAGIETSRVISLGELGLPDENRVHYEPAPWGTLRRILPRREVRDTDVLLDFGCGKGRMLIEAATYPFKRVIGVEVSEVLADAARSNVARMQHRFQSRAVEVVTSDAVDYEIPDDVTIVYFFNPFRREVFARVLDNLVASIRSRPREVRIVYLQADEEHQLLDAGAVRIKTVRALRPTRAWSIASGMHMYKLGPALPKD